MKAIEPSFEQYKETQRLLVSKLDMLSRLISRYPVVCAVDYSHEFVFNTKEDIEYTIKMIEGRIKSLERE